MSKRFSPPKLAALWHVNKGKIIALIMAGELEAIDLASPGSKRPRYSISEEAIAAFELRRSVVTRAQKPVRRQKLPALTKRYV